jgi:hypothetical protein
VQQAISHKSSTGGQNWLENCAGSCVLQTGRGGVLGYIGRRPNLDQQRG